MGKNVRSNSIIFASWIHAKRRWAMTGTPTSTTSNFPLNLLKNLFGLIKFLKEEPIPTDDLSNQIYRPWNEGHLYSFVTLVSILQHIMMRHTKLDIDLPRPEFQTRKIQMSV